MTGMVTYVGLDVHARSTHAAAIDVSTGELVRARFGPGVEEPVAWLAESAGAGAGGRMRRGRVGSVSFARVAGCGGGVRWR